MPTNFANFVYYGKAPLPDDAEPVFKNVNNRLNLVVSNFGIRRPYPLEQNYHVFLSFITVI